MAGGGTNKADPEDTRRTESRRGLLILAAVVILGFTLYIVLITPDHDLTALLLGILAVFLIVVFVWASGRLERNDRRWDQLIERVDKLIAARQSSAAGPAAPTATLDSSASDGRPISESQSPPMETRARFCPYCGTQNASDYSFCAKCGKALPQRS
jgi:Ca2+/Na+ antiporter